MRRRWSWLAASLFAASAAEGRTVLRQDVEIRILPDGRVSENVRLRVRIDHEADREGWSPYAILLDENRELLELQALVERPDGRVVTLDRKALDTVAPAQAQVLHHSQRYRTVAFPPAPNGSIYSLSYRLTVKPYFSSDSIAVPLGDPIEQLRVSVRGPEDLRYKLSGEVAGLSLRPTADGVELTGERIAAQPTRSHADAALADAALLRFAWGPARDWPAIGDWYAALVATVARGAPEVRAQAAAFKAADDRTTIANALAHVRRNVRYVAVEVGVGGYRPRPPQRVRELGWGDCKDKALLLIDYLAALEIEAYPALIRAAFDERVDAAFPSPDQFNHLIVAVPAAHFTGAEAVAESDGYVFLDPTQERGGLSYFPSYLQGQDALVSRRGQSRLVRTRLGGETDTRRVEIDVAPADGGGFAGRAKLLLGGAPARSFIDGTSSQRAEESKRTVEALLRARFPEADITEASWQVAESDEPRAELAGAIALRIGNAARSLHLAWAPSTPPLAVLENRSLPVVLEPARSDARWRIRLPPGWCAPKEAQQKVENAVGLFSQTVRVAGDTVEVERTARFRKRWVEVEEFELLSQLALLEHRTRARSLRFECAP